MNSILPYAASALFLSYIIALLTPGHVTSYPTNREAFWLFVLVVVFLISLVVTGLGLIWRILG